MTDSMKFGPEWLRNLAGDSCNSGGSGGGTANLITPRYQLAEHRYGREEMLALFDRNCKPPESIIGQQMLYVEKTQLPLAFIPETEDETRLRNSGLSSTGGRGRGGSVDRGGRIRTGRGGIYTSHFSRGGFDDSGDGGSRLDTQSYPGRSRNFDRSQSERGWSERNGNIDANDWNGSTSPRKELSRGPSGSSLMESNWRRHRGAGDDEEGWRSNNNRSEKWIRGSWRDGGGSDRDRLDRVDADGDDNRISGRWEARASHRSSHDSSHHHHPPPTRTSRTWDSNHHDNHDNLPEWATENPAESGGSFDASGAFHGGMFSDDDDDGTGGNHSSSRTRRVSEGTNSTKAKSSKPTSYSNNINQNAHRQMINDSVSHTVARERPKSLHPFENKENSGEQGHTDSPSKQSVAPSNNSSSPLTKSTTMSSINTNTAGKKVSNVAINPTKINSESERVQLPQRSKSFVELPSKNNSSSNNSSVSSHSINSQQTNPVPRSSASNQKTELLQTNLQNTSKSTTATIASTTTATISTPQRAMASQKLDDDLDGFKEEADMQSLVAKLMADEENHREESTHVLPSVVNHVPPLASATSQEKWYYRDPQGEVQGPFLASEMAEWCKAGYFTPNLLVRRTCDERYATLGDLMKICGRVPFTPGPPIPPLKLTEPVLPTIPPPVPTGLPGSALPKPGIDDPLLLLQYQQLQMIQSQQLLLRQMKNSAIAKLSQSDSWSGLSPIEQNQLVMQCVMQNSEVRDLSLATNPFVTPLAAPPPPATNPVMQLFNQMQQAKVQSDSHLPSNPHAVPPVHTPTTLDPIQQLIQQMGGIQNLPGPPQPSINPSSIQQQSTPEEDPIKSLLRQLHINANGHSQSHQMDSIWPQPPPQINPQFNAQNWLAQVGPLPAMPPGQMPNSLWDLHTKDIKTEQQILEEQNIRIQERKEELRKQEELKRQAEDASNKRKLEEEQNKKLEEAQRKEEERKRKEEEKRLKMEEKRKLEEELKKKEDKKRKEEERKREEKRKQDEENNRKKQEEEKKKREEAKRQEEKLRKEEEKRKKAEEEQKRLEEEKLKKEEEEARKKAEAEEQARRTEQRRREAEALKKLQEKSKAPWAQAPHAPPPTTHASLAEIQRLEREKKAEELRLQQLMQQQLAQQKALEATKEQTAAVESSKRLTFKWAEKAAPSTNQPQVKSLAQIQQEEQERIVKVKQQEKERSEKANQKEAAVVMQNAGIWGSASQSLNWTSTVNSVGDASKFGSKPWTGGGFWDEPAPVKPAAPVKQAAKNSTANKTANQQQQQVQQQQNNNKTTKNKAKKEEETVKKLFENNTAKTDDFTQWCNRTLSGLQVSVDVPTFVGFLRDIESAYEVKEYIKMYLGDNKQCTEFAKQFLEKRSKWRSSQRPQTEADDLCKPAPAVNPNAPTEFQEVKGKSKKPKKGKMFKVDNRILGFSVTAATDRINVGDRDYGEGV